MQLRPFKTNNNDKKMNTSSTTDDLMTETRPKKRNYRRANFDLGRANKRTFDKQFGGLILQSLLSTLHPNNRLTIVSTRVRCRNGFPLHNIRSEGSHFLPPVHASLATPARGRQNKGAGGEWGRGRGGETTTTKVQRLTQNLHSVIQTCRKG